MSYPHYDLVVQAYNELLAEGKIKARSTQDQVEADKGLVTCRAAWYVNQQRDPMHGQLYKASGNNYKHLSVDWILDRTDGTGWDIMTDDGVNAFPSNGGPEAPDPARIPDWRQPTAELAQIGTPAPGPDPGPEPTPDDDDLTAAINTLTALMIEQSEQIYHLMTQGFYGECAMGMHMSFGMKAAPMPPEALHAARVRQDRLREAAMQARSASTTKLRKTTVISTK